MILLQGWQPHQVMAPIAQCTPVMPFRDAGYSVADFIITIQDIVYGLWRAKQHGLIELREFNLNEYEQYELVENGDLNAIGSMALIPFAKSSWNTKETLAPPLNSLTLKSEAVPSKTCSYSRLISWWFQEENVQCVSSTQY
ncbi:hypothetical protein FF38_04453 [Lucilia cuprina]|uniref:Dual specificity/tyrosine protein phosphatase N-terminal domain-containing protein n=1 Tax=Lucilia cuprina TaxID=7375 RepID=A0A0L0CRN1_LUCCU|nr:hypothetical protein FF38_04453 [Lucilia cuprina]